jgi:hypothetical protein
LTEQTTKYLAPKTLNAALHFVGNKQKIFFPICQACHGLVVLQVAIGLE